MRLVLQMTTRLHALFSNGTKNRVDPRFESGWAHSYFSFTANFPGRETGHKRSDSTRFEFRIPGGPIHISLSD